ncbi:MAG TPA: Hsp20 family protein [Bacteroidales bacterium]|nr:Hsp20 family protein [Bacteroidales bacterium]
MYSKQIYRKLTGLRSKTTLDSDTERSGPQKCEPDQPNTANSEKIAARYENGILKVSIPKKEEAKPKPARQIQVS